MKNILGLSSLAFILLAGHDPSFAQYSYDSVTFEMPTNKIVIGTNDNLWQIGNPQKTFFNAAHGGTKAILTDTLDFYPPNDTSSFIYIIRNPYTQTCITSMEFWHKYDTDTLEDQGIIEASYDGGISWVMVDDTSNLPPWGGNFFWWEPDYHASTGNYTEHLSITSGKSDGWILSTFLWQWWIPVDADTIILNPDSLMIRFTFMSDDVNTDKEGWMIDDIVTSSAWWQICSSINEMPGKETVSVYPNPFSSQTTLEVDKPLRHANLTIYDAFGRPVKQMVNISGEKISLSRDNLPAGPYLITIRENKRAFSVVRLFITD